MKFLQINLLKEFLTQSLKLLSSGLITSIGFVVLSSGRLEFVNSDIVLEILIFTQYLMIGLTVCKFGVDNLLYVNFLVDETKKYSPFNYIKKNGLYLILIFSLIIYFIEKDLVNSILVFLCLLLDVMSILIIVQLGARKFFGQVFIGNFLSYPLFFVSFLILGFFFNFNKIAFVLLFLSCATLRFLVVGKFYRDINAVEMNPKFEFKLGFQQLLNYVLFKSDQILFSLGTLSMIWFGYNKNELQKYMFLSRFPELISGVLVSLVFLYGSKMTITNKNDFVELIKKYKLSLIGYIFLLLFFFLAYTLFWKGDSFISIGEFLPYLLISILIFFVNMVTLGFLKHEKINKLNFNLSISIFLAVLFQFFLLFISVKSSLLWITPMQMIIFVFLILFEKNEIN
ncbi:hypothetical protein [Flavobacterium sp.]|uniref:hypothetical protein n=1 Tax=Flavobacterium sp. TaxID=239 RepID=UPI003D0B93EE